jgi:uncharacterized protein DUF4340
MARRRPFGPLSALALLLILGAWIYFKDVRAGKKGPEDDAAKSRPIAFERADLKSIRLKNGQGEVALEKSGEAWKIVEPLAVDTDKDAVESLISSVESARVDRRLAPAADLKAYGLDPPKASLTLGLAKGANLAPTLAIGDGSPVGGSFFALLPGGKDLAVVSSTLGDLTKKDLLGLRDKSLLALDPWKVKKLRIERGRENILLEKPDDGWKLQQPIECPADGPAITDLLSALERLRATSFESEKPAAGDLRKRALDPPTVRLTLLQEGWDVEKTVLFGRTPDGSLHARTLGRDPIVAIPKDFWNKVSLGVPGLRRNDLLGVGQYRLETITAARKGRPALVMTRQKDGTWKLTGAATGSVKSPDLDILLNTLGALKAESFDDHPAETLRASLARSPVLELTLQEEADSSGHPGKSQHLVFGPPDKKGRILARDMAWRPIAVIPGAPFTTITDQLDAVVKKAAEEAKASPSPSASPAASPGAAPAPAPSPARR